jgi:DNA polymerase III gamma/tau subunit
MRTAISLMDKCLSYSKDLTIKNIVKALGVADYDTMKELTDALWYKPDNAKIIDIIEGIHNSGKDLKQFIRQYLNFVLDIKKFIVLNEFDYLSIPETEEMSDWLKRHTDYDEVSDWLDLLIRINAEIKYDSSPKYMIEAMLLGGINEN